MSRTEKTVFISYRRTNVGYALAIFQYLTAQGYDVFLDYNNIDNGDFGQIILNNIASRAHFVVLLTPSALERLNEEGDWLRREIEYALETKRNIVPITLDQFNWGDSDKYLTGKLAVIKSYSALRAPADYFSEAMDRLCTRYLNIPLDAVIHPRSAVAQQAANKAQQQAQAEPQVQEQELTAQEWFEKGLNAPLGSQEKIDCYTKAIELKPDYADAYYNRGNSLQTNGDLTGAIQDYNKAIEIKPDYSEAYNNRGGYYFKQGDYYKAKADFAKAVQLDPNNEVARKNLEITTRKLA
ncbi:MAG: tetratricopeptide repeat protein [Phototrophicaceae bacterium]